MTFIQRCRFAFVLLLMTVVTAPALAQKKKPQKPGPAWLSMDLGPTFTSTIGPDKGVRFDGVSKGLAIRVGEGDHAGGVLFCTDTVRMVAGWTGGFVNIGTGRNALLANDRISGTAHWATHKGPGWAKDGSFNDPRPKPFGPIPASQAKWKGHYMHGDKVILSYTVAGTQVYETPSMTMADDAPLFVRHLWVGPSDKPIELAVTRSNRKADGTAGAFATTDVGLVRVASKRKVQLKADGKVISAVIGPSKSASVVTVSIWSKKGLNPDPTIGVPTPNVPAGPDIAAMLKGGPARYPKPATTEAVRGKDDSAYTVDTVTAPYDNPWRSVLHFGGHDFFSDGRAAICTMEGDVFVVSSDNNGAVHKAFEGDSNKVHWRRFATGMYHPLGLKIVDDKIYVLCRDQITRLHDINGNGEADFYENFNNDIKAGFNSHEFATCLETDPHGNFFFIKGTNGGQTEHDSSVHMVSKDGKTLTRYATGFRWPNGFGMSKTGVITAADQQGTWIPSSRLDIVEKGGFYGFMNSHHRATPPTTYDGPLCWIPHKVDNSCGGQTWVESDKWGPLKGNMLHLSYGRCLLFLVVHEKVEGVPGKTHQGGVVQFPCDKFLSGAMRARFSDHDGQLYVSGLKGWQTNGARDGCFQRVRYTGKQAHLPKEIKVTKTGVQLTFTEPLDKAAAGDADNWSAERWNYRWTKGYGSKEYSVETPNKTGHDPMDITAVNVSADGKTVMIEMPDIAPVMQQSIRWNIKGADGQDVRGTLYHTIHATP